MLGALFVGLMQVVAPAPAEAPIEAPVSSTPAAAADPEIDAANRVRCRVEAVTASRVRRIVRCSTPRNDEGRTREDQRVMRERNNFGSEGDVP